MSEERDDIIILLDENGDEVEFEHIDTISYNGSEYVVLLPNDEHGDDEECDCEECDEEEVIILKVEQTGEDEDTLVTFDDEEEQNAVFEIFSKRMEEMELLDYDDAEDDLDDLDDIDGEEGEDGFDGGEGDGDFESDDAGETD
jgi:uncharacterized protein YrzB (UPF0473 family)